jgi:hypothetical protein
MFFKEPEKTKYTKFRHYCQRNKNTRIDPVMRIKPEMMITFAFMISILIIMSENS